MLPSPRPVAAGPPPPTPDRLLAAHHLDGLAARFDEIGITAVAETVRMVAAHYRSGERRMRTERVDVERRLDA